MKKSQEPGLRQRVGDLSALCGMKEYTLSDGPVHGMRAFDLRNGQGIDMTVLPDRGMDLSSLYFKGQNMGFLSKTGIRSPYLYAEDGGRGFLRQFYGGLLTTCGLTYAGAAGMDEGRMLGLHGPASNLPASRVCAEMAYEGDDAILRLRGEVRESCVFEENMLLRRAVTLETERNVVRIDDIVENQGFRREPLMLVYHVNFGYPLLDEGARVYSSATEVAPRDVVAQEELAMFSHMEAPGIGRPEACFYHSGFVRDDAFAMVHNARLGMAAVVGFDAGALPLLCQWKCMRAGDYALGLEPTTSGVTNRSEARANGLLTYLEPGESRAFALTLAFLDDPQAIEAYRARATAGNETKKRTSSGREGIS